VQALLWNWKYSQI